LVFPLNDLSLRGGDIRGESEQKVTGDPLLTFLAKPAKKAGMRAVKLRTVVLNAQVVAADSVYVPASE
jgi:hypothetical protein